MSRHSKHQIFLNQLRILQSLFFLPSQQCFQSQTPTKAFTNFVGRSRAFYHREEKACICLPPGVAISFLPSIKKFLFFFLASKSNLSLLLHLLPGEDPQIAKQHLKQPLTSSENHGHGTAWGFPAKDGRRDGRIMVINTSKITEGIHVWACSAAYVDPAASFRGWFNPAADLHIHNSLIDRDSFSHSQKLLKMEATGQSGFVQEISIFERRDDANSPNGGCLDVGWDCGMVEGSRAELIPQWQTFVSISDYQNILLVMHSANT